jgi:transposase
MIRMLIIGYCLGIRSERRLCEEVKLNLAYRWFCRLSIEDAVAVAASKQISHSDPQARWTAAPGDNENR